MCYENAYKLATEVSEIDADKCSILYCYVPSYKEKYHYRHVFCLQENEIVEPLLHLNIDKINIQDIIPIRQMNLNEYFKSLTAEKYYDLSNLLLEDEVDAFNNHRPPLNIIDFIDLIRRATNSDETFLTVLNQVQNGGDLIINRQVEIQEAVIYDSEEGEDLEQ